jgi:hypothetical protein
MDRPALTAALIEGPCPREGAVLKTTFAELLRSCSRNISPACCLACVTPVAGRSTRLPLSFIRAVVRFQKRASVLEIESDCLAEMGDDLISYARIKIWVRFFKLMLRVTFNSA